MDVSGVDDAMFRLMVEKLPQTVWLATPDGFVEYLNPTGMAYTGQSLPASHLDWLTLVHADDVEQLAVVREQAQRECIPYRMKCRLRRVEAPTVGTPSAGCHCKIERLPG